MSFQTLLALEATVYPRARQARTYARGASCESAPAEPSPVGPSEGEGPGIGPSQVERRLISQRTKEALAVKRTSGVRLGRPRSLPRPVVLRIQRQRACGDSLRKIAADLNEAQAPTAQGGRRGFGRRSGTSCSGRRNVTLNCTRRSSRRSRANPLHHESGRSYGTPRVRSSSPYGPRRETELPSGLSWDSPCPV
jgi:hypothetical protein